MLPPLLDKGKPGILDMRHEVSTGVCGVGFWALKAKDDPRGEAEQTVVGQFP